MHIINCSRFGDLCWYTFTYLHACTFTHTYLLIHASRVESQPKSMPDLSRSLLDLHVQDSASRPQQRVMPCADLPRSYTRRQTFGAGRLGSRCSPSQRPSARCNRSRSRSPRPWPRAALPEPSVRPSLPPSSGSILEAQSLDAGTEDQTAAGLRGPRGVTRPRPSRGGEKGAVPRPTASAGFLSPLFLAVFLLALAKPRCVS